MIKIFISHSSEDNDFADKLHKILAYEWLLDVWIDLKDIIGGERYWSDSVELALNECSVMLLIVSPQSMLSPHVKDEWTYFLDRQKRIIPIIYKRDKVSLPFRLHQTQYIDFSTLEFDTALSKLRKSLESFEVKFTSPSITLNHKKTGNLFWLCHDLLELHHWLLGNVEKEWLDVGFRQSYHHAKQLQLAPSVQEQIRQLMNDASQVNSEQWKIPDVRHKFAHDVKIFFNLVAQIAQRFDPDFETGPG